jgi:hypothetical protein
LTYFFDIAYLTSHHLPFRDIKASLSYYNMANCHLIQLFIAKLLFYVAALLLLSSNFKYMLAKSQGDVRNPTPPIPDNMGQ